MVDHRLPWGWNGGGVPGNLQGDKFTARCVYSFDPPAGRETAYLRLAEGDKVEVLRHQGSGPTLLVHPWALGRVADSPAGWFPSSYVVPLSDKPVPRSKRTERILKRLATIVQKDATELDDQLPVRDDTVRFLLTHASPRAEVVFPMTDAVMTTFMERYATILPKPLPRAVLGVPAERFAPGPTRPGPARPGNRHNSGSRSLIH